MDWEAKDFMEDQADVQMNPRLCSESRMATVMGSPICVTFSANTAMGVYRGTLPGNSF